MNELQNLPVSYYGYGGYSHPIITNESPETAIARITPFVAAKLLDRKSKREHYGRVLSIGAQLATAYIEGLDEEKRFKITRIQIHPEKRIGFFGIFGKGLEIKFIRDKNDF